MEEQLKTRIRDLLLANQVLIDRMKSMKDKVEILFRELDMKETGAFMSVCEAKDWILGEID